MTGLNLNKMASLREDSQIDFSRETSFGRIFETPSRPSEKRQYLKIPENRFLFQIENSSFDIISIIRGPRPRTGSARMGLF